MDKERRSTIRGGMGKMIFTKLQTIILPTHVNCNIILPKSAHVKERWSIVCLQKRRLFPWTLHHSTPENLSTLT